MNLKINVYECYRKFLEEICSYTNRSSTMTLTLWIYDIEMIISIEISDKDTNLMLSNIVTVFVIHGPCGNQNQKSPCMKSKKGMKYFLNKYGDHIIIDQDG